MAVSNFEVKGGLRTQPKQLGANGLHWMAYQRKVLEMAGRKSVVETDEGGYRIRDPKVAARVMNAIYTGREKIKEGFNLEGVSATPDQAATIRNMIRTAGGELKLQLFQRLLDGESSYDLRGFAELVNRALQKQGFNITTKDLMDPEMKKLLKLPGCGVLGCTYGPAFELTVEDDPNLLVYDPGNFAGNTGTFVFDRTKDRFSLNPDKGFVVLHKHGGTGTETDTAPLAWAFAYVFSQMGLSGLRLSMTRYQPLTAIGGMGMSNNLLDAVLLNAHFLLNTGATLGDIYSQGGYLEKYMFDRETGKQESQQNMAGGHNILRNAPGIFGGLMRRLDLRAHTADIMDLLHLTVWERPLGNVQRPRVNDEWVRLSLEPQNELVFMAMKDVASGELAPFVAAANGGSLDKSGLITSYDGHRAYRDVLCHGYVGTPEQIAYYKQVREMGGTVMPLGEGTLTAACGTLLPAAKFNTLGLKKLTESDALATSGTLSGQVPFELLDSMPAWSGEYTDLASSGLLGFPRPALQVVDYKN